MRTAKYVGDIAVPPRIEWGRILAKPKAKSYCIAAAAMTALYGTSALAQQKPQYVGMPKLVLEQLCEKSDAGCRYFIGGVADTLYYAAKGTICLPMKESNGLTSIDLDSVVASAKNAMSLMAFDQDMAAGLFLVWKASYPCQK